MMALHFMQPLYPPLPLSNRRNSALRDFLPVLFYFLCHGFTILFGGTACEHQISR